MSRLSIAVLSTCLLFGVASPSRAPWARPACVCIPNSDWQATRRGASALFTGIVIADSIVDPPFLTSDSVLSHVGNPAHKVTFIVEHAWKLAARTQTDSILVSIWDVVGTSCSMHFSMHERYLVVALSGGDWVRLVDSASAVPGRTQLSPAADASLWTHKCMGTQPIASARGALQQLGPGVPIADSGPPRPKR